MLKRLTTRPVGPENPISSRSPLVVVMHTTDFLHLDDLASLHGTPEFEAIVAEVRRRSEESETTK